MLVGSAYVELVGGLLIPRSPLVGKLAGMRYLGVSGQEAPHIATKPEARVEHG